MPAPSTPTPHESPDSTPATPPSPTPPPGVFSGGTTFFTFVLSEIERQWAALQANLAKDAAAQCQIGKLGADMLRGAAQSAAGGQVPVIDLNGYQVGGAGGVRGPGVGWGRGGGAGVGGEEKGECRGATPSPPPAAAPSAVSPHPSRLDPLHARTARPGHGNATLQVSFRGGGLQQQARLKEATC
jgi:hypothetical protein